jgi:hypothetical protein
MICKFRFCKCKIASGILLPFSLVTSEKDTALTKTKNYLLNNLSSKLIFDIEKFRFKICFYKIKLNLKNPLLET